MSPRFTSSCSYNRTSPTISYGSNQLRAKVFIIKAFINLICHYPWQFVEVSVTTTQDYTNFLHIWSSHLMKLLIQHSSYRACSSRLNDKLHSFKYLSIDIRGMLIIIGMQILVNLHRVN